MRRMSRGVEVPKLINGLIMERARFLSVHTRGGKVDNTPFMDRARREIEAEFLLPIKHHQEAT